MPQIPHGVPFLDLIVPPGMAERVEDLQTRLDVLGAVGWRVYADDGTMEQSPVPSQPIRGADERIQVVRQQPWHPSEPFSEAASLLVELAVLSQARLASAGVYGSYAWGLVLFEDMSQLHGLVLLDWLYNPRLSEVGEILEEDDEPPEQRLTRKLKVFQALWTPQHSAAMAERMPPGSIADVEGYKALTLLGPGGSFDPRYWQSFAMQMAMAEVQAHAQAMGTAPAPSEEAGGSGIAQLAGMGAAPEASPEQPDDGLSPLARAELEAAAAAEEASARPVEQVSEPVEQPVQSPLRWVDGEAGPVLWVPQDRYDASLVRSLREGSTGRLAKSEAPSGELFERWFEGGGAFVTEAPSFARLFLDNVPLHRAKFEQEAREIDGFLCLDCHLPRVARVRAVLLPPKEGKARRILVSSDRLMAPAALVALAH